MWYLTLTSIKFDPDSKKDLKLGEMIGYTEFQNIEIFKSQQHEMTS